MLNKGSARSDLSSSIFEAPKPAFQLYSVEKQGSEVGSTRAASRAMAAKQMHLGSDQIRNALESS